MRARFDTWIRRIGLIPVAFVAVAAITSAIRTASWEPVVTLGWLPAVIVAAYSRPGAGRCGRRRGMSDVTE